MRTAYWEAVRRSGFAVPSDEPLTDLTAELTVLVGEPDPATRDLAREVLTAWVEAGVYDGLLATLGDGLAAGLTVGLDREEDDTVFRRVSCARLVGACVARETALPEVGSARVLAWGDQLLTWFVRERDLRGYVPGRGWAHAAAAGADALAALAASPALGEAELVAVLDVLAERLAAPTRYALVDREDDHLARTVMVVLRRGAVEPALVEGWLERLAEVATVTDPQAPPSASAGNAERLLRAVHLQVTLGSEPPPHRADLSLAVAESLRRTNAAYLRPGPTRR